jgi:hypothetical protein
MRDFFSPNFYTGIVENEPNSFVICYFERQDQNTKSYDDIPLIIYAQIRIQIEKEGSTTYYVEPLVDKETNSVKYIIYKSDDVDSGIVSNGVFK